MYKLNHLNYALPHNAVVDKVLSLEPLKTNFEFDKLKRDFKMKFNFTSLNTFSFSKEGFLGLFLELKGDIAVSLGESEALLQACKLYESLGKKVEYIPLLKEGSIDYEAVKNLNCENLFISSYVIDTFVITDLEKVREYFKGTIISNASASFERKCSDMVYFDAYKLTGYFTHSVVLHNDILEEQNLANIDTIGIKLIFDEFHAEEKKLNCKEKFVSALQDEIKENFFFFVQPEKTLEKTLHFGLKGIKARQVIRNLSLSNVFVTNGEGCSLGLSKPSRVLQAMGYSKLESRQALSLSFEENFLDEDIKRIAKKISKSYRQIKALNE